MPFALTIAPIRWAEIPDFPGYRVSDDGVIQSRWKIVGLGRPRGCASVIGDQWKTLKLKVDKDGYLEVGLRREGKQYFKKVHQWMMLAFFGLPPKGMEVRHKDGTKRNILSNLEYGTCLQNQQDRRRHGTNFVGERHPQAKFSNDQIRRIRWLAGILPQQKIAEMMGTTAGYISRVVRKEVRKEA